MVEYRLAHVGINCTSAEEGRKGAVMFEAMFGLAAKEGNSSVFAGQAVELLKSPYLGKNGHIAIGTSDVAAAFADLKERGFVMNMKSAKYKADGTMNVIYLADEICGFAVHLVESK